MHSSILIGALALFSHTASGLVFRDKLSQVIEGTKYYVVYGTDGEDSVRFERSSGSNFNAQGWKFDTEGYPDDQAVITPLESDSALLCLETTTCFLSSDGSNNPFRLARPDSSKPVFTIQDVESTLYVCRGSELSLDLVEEVSDPCYFTLEKI